MAGRHLWRAVAVAGAGLAAGLKVAQLLALGQRVGAHKLQVALADLYIDLDGSASSRPSLLRPRLTCRCMPRRKRRASQESNASLSAGT